MSLINLVRVPSCLKDLAAAKSKAQQGLGNQYYCFRWSGDRRQYWVNSLGWVLVGSGNRSNRKAYDTSSKTRVQDVGSQQTLISEKAAKSIPDVFEVRYASKDGRFVVLESYHPTIIKRFKNYKTLSYKVGEENLWTNKSQFNFGKNGCVINSDKSEQSLFEAIYLADGNGTENTTWMPATDREGDTKSNFNPRLWLRAADKFVFEVPALAAVNYELKQNNVYQQGITDFFDKQYCVSQFRLPNSSWSGDSITLTVDFNGDVATGQTKTFYPGESLILDFPVYEVNTPRLYLPPDFPHRFELSYTSSDKNAKLFINASTPEGNSGLSAINSNDFTSFSRGLSFTVELCS